MSFNRGFRRDDRSSSYRSNFGQNSNQRSMNVSPWECGVAPNAGMSRSGLPIQSLLPTPQTQTNPNILSQQQHALVMASNLLSNLGLLQQQPQRQQELPSLINMSTMNHMGTSGSFHLQSQNYGQANNRYNNQGSMRRKPQDNHRAEPYKNRARPIQSQQFSQQQGRRPVANKPVQERKSGPGSRGAVPLKALPDLRQKILKPAKTSNKSEEDSDDVEVNKAKLLETSSAGDAESKNSFVDEEAKRDDDEENGKKRDWKDEKKTEQVVDEEENVTGDAPSDSNVDGVKVEAVATQDAEVETSCTEKVDEDKPASKSTEKKFACYVCNKFMYDEVSLNNHVKSKAHKLSMVELDNNYKAQVEALRMNMQESVRRQELDMNNQRGTYVHRTRDFCKMCDLNFFGSIANHRKNDLHLQLKTFLHPRCVPCGKEFPTRMEWENHRLSVGHQTSKRVKDDEYGNRSDSDRALLKVGRVAKEAVFDPQFPFGLDYLVTVQHCRACNLYFDHRSDARAHCKTQEHFDNCAKSKAKEAEIVVQVDTVKEVDVEIKVEKATIEADVVPVDGIEEPVQDPELAETVTGAKQGIEDNEGNWKRCRVADTEENDDIIISSSAPKRRAVELLLVEGSPPSAAASQAITDPSKLYDPLEEEEDMELQESQATPVAEYISDTVLEDLDRAIDSILDTVEEDESATDKSDKDLDSADKDLDCADKDLDSAEGEVKTNGPVRGINKAKRGARGRKRK